VVKHEAKLEFSDIDHIVLVGGSTRLMCVKKILSEMFGREPVVLGNVDEVVALGAALYARKLTECKTTGNPIHNVCNHGYGFIYAERNPVTNQIEERNRILIPKNTEVPFEFEQLTGSSMDDQRELLYRVTQGESEDIDMVSVIKKVVVPLPPGMPAGTAVRVKFRYDINQCMHCSFVISGEEKGEEIELDLNKLA